MRSSRRSLYALASLALGALLIAGATPGRAARRADQLPNLVALPPFDVEPGPADGSTTDTALRFSVGVANRGAHPLELNGVAESAESATALQCVEWAAPRACMSRSEVGRLVWHPDHGHHHFEDFARYDLRRIKKSGVPDLRPKALVAGGQKISFCLLDYESDGETSYPGGDYAYPGYWSCLAGGMQGISPGWRDVYVSQLEGQQILLDGVPDGIYALVAVIDPENRLFETSDADNTAATRIEVHDEGGAIRVVCAYSADMTSCEPPPESTDEGSRRQTPR